MLKNTNILRFLLGQSLSFLGSMLVQYALIWHLTLTTKSGSIMTLAILASFIPNLLISPFAGAWADTYPRKWVIIFADGFIALVTLIIAVFFVRTDLSVSIILLVLTVRAIGSAIYLPALRSFIPELVEEKELSKVQGIQSSIESAVTILGPILAAFLLANVEMFYILLIDVITASFAILINMGIKVQTNKHSEKSKQSILQDWKDGFSYMKQHDFLLKFFFFAAAVNFLIAPVALLNTLQTVTKFGDEAWRLSYTEIAFGIGMLLGGLALSKYEGFKNRMTTLLVTVLLFGVLSMGLSFSPNFIFYLGIMFLFGLVIPYHNVPSTVIIQEKVEDTYLGRVFGVFSMISSSIMPLSLVLLGPLADWIGIDAVVSLAGLVTIILFFLLKMMRFEHIID